MVRFFVFFILGFSLIQTSALSAPKKLRVYLDWFPNIEFAGLLVAKEKGWYKKKGIELDLVFEGLDIIPNLLKGQADIGMHSAHDLIKHAQEGAPVKAFAAKYQFNPNSIISRKDSNILQMKDFKGKKLGIFSPQEYDVYRVMLGTAGLTLKDVSFVKIDTFDERKLIDLLKTGKVDGFVVWDFNWPVSFSLLGYPVRVFRGPSHGFHFYGIVYFTTNEYLKKNKKLLADFLEVTFRGWHEVYRDPLHYTKLVIKKYYPKDKLLDGSLELTEKQQFLELKLRRRYLFEGVGEKKLGAMSDFSWRRSLEIAKKYKMIPRDSKLKVTDLSDSSVLDIVFGRMK